MRRLRPFAGYRR